MSPARDFFATALGIGSGVVGATVETCSVGVSDVTTGLARGRGGVAGRQLLAALTGCSGHTAVAKSSIVGNRWSGSFAIARLTAAEIVSDMSGRSVFGACTSSKMCL